MPRMATFTELNINEDTIEDESCLLLAFDKRGDRVTWGMPAMICQALGDKSCPRCSATLDDVQYNSTQLISGFELNGKDGLCGCCGFAIGEAIGASDTIKKDTNKTKQGSRKSRNAVAKLRSRKRKRK